MRVEAAYEGKVEAKKLLDSYKGFKAVVPAEQKNIWAENLKQLVAIRFIEQFELPRKKGKERFLLESKFELQELVRERASTSLTICRRDLQVGETSLTDFW